MQFLHKPLKPLNISQHFGENLACVENNATNSAPLNKRKVVSSNGICQPGYEKLYPLLGLPNGHTGLDLVASHGQPLYASHDGFIQEIQTEAERGLGLGIVSNEKFDMGKWGVNFVKTRYWHLQGFKVKLGDQVKAGDLIGWCDNTGYSSGDHCHWELKPVNQDSAGNWVNTFQYETGAFGAIDPLPFVLPTHAQDLKQITLIKSILEAAKRLLALLTKK